MQASDAEGNVFPAHAAEAGLFHQRREAALVGKAADRLDEVGVGLGRSGHGRAEARDHEIGVEVVEGREPAVRPREFEAGETPAGFQHAADFRQRRFEPRRVAQAEGDRQQVDAGVGEGQGFGLAGDPAQRRRAALAALVHHRQARVADEDLAAFPGDQPRHVAGAAGQVDGDAAHVGATPGERPLPQPMDAEAHEVVHEVVAWRHGREHATDAIFALVGRNAVAAEAVVEGGRFLHGDSHKKKARDLAALRLRFPACAVRPAS